MESLFKRHDAYLSKVPMEYVRDFMQHINWNSRLLVIRGPKGVGKSTLMQQYIKQHFPAGDRHVLYCSADTNYFSTHTLLNLAENFVMMGGQWLFIDEVHKYPGWSREIKEIYDLYHELHIVLSGSSLIQINDGQADLSRRLMPYDMPGLSLREFIHLDTGLDIKPVSLDQLLDNPSKVCMDIISKCHPLEHFARYRQFGYYPFYFEEKQDYYDKLENTVNYIVDVELTKYRSLDVGYTRQVKALLHVISQMTPYEVDISKLSKASGISRQSTLKYLTNMEEANLIRRVFTNLMTVTDLQKPEIGTVRETFFANQLASAGHKVEYAGYKKGDFRIDGDIVIEVGGQDKGFSQVADQENAYVAADDIESAYMRKIPLWAFGFLY